MTRFMPRVLLPLALFCASIGPPSAVYGSASGGSPSSGGAGGIASGGFSGTAQTGGTTMAGTSGYLRRRYVGELQFGTSYAFSGLVDWWDTSLLAALGIITMVGMRRRRAGATATRSTTAA